ncbi:13562_t:CDS:1, partial [Ambispora leptoticha]
FNLETGNDINEAAKNLAGTTIANIEPDCDDNISENKRPKINIKTIKGISKLFFWNWPVEGRHSRYIRARPLPHIGEWNNFTSAYV